MPDDGLLLRSLAAIVGAEHVTQVAADLASCAVDDVIPQVVVSPGSVDEVQAVVRAASQQRASIVPRGSGSKMGLGGPPRSADVVLRLGRLDTVIEYDVANLTFVAQAGLRIETLQANALANEQFLPLDPPFTRQATVGGVVAANSSGPRRLAYGSARDLVLGMKVVSAAGEVLSAGGKTVKNVAGYDLDKLLIGSLGTLGIIVEVAFKLLPVPEQRATVLAAFPGIAPALEMAARLRQSQYLPVAVELLNARALEACGLGSGTNGLLIALEGVSESVERQRTEIATLCGQHGSPVVDILDGKAEADAWTRIRDLSLALVSRSPSVAALKCCVSLSEVAGFSKLVGEAAEKRGLPLCLDVRVGSGIVYAWLEGQAGDEARQVGAISELRSAARLSGGSLVIDSASSRVKVAVSVWGEPGSDFAAMKAVKAKLDPLGLLNPGRYLGGI